MGKKDRDVQDDFLSHIIHEINSPLSGIQSLLTLIDESSPAFTPQQQQNFRIIGEFVYHLRMLTTNARFFATLSKDAYVMREEVITISDLLKDIAVLKSFACQAHDLDLLVDCSQDLPPVKADRILLGQVILNLVDNAIKYTPAKGRITLSAHFLDKGVELSVVDTGPGIAEDDLERVREPYTQLQKGEGFGLGLALVDQYAKLLGAKFTLESTPGLGTKAMLYLDPSMGDGTAI